MKNVEEFLDWLVELDIRHYKTESTPDYEPSGKSHFYLAGSPERFTSEEMCKIWEGKTKDLSYNLFHDKASSIVEGYKEGSLFGTQDHIEAMFSDPDKLVILTEKEFLEKLETDEDFSDEWQDPLLKRWLYATSDHSQYKKRH